ncbi:MAG: DUF6688 family protein [Pirellulales bacterium]
MSILTKTTFFYAGVVLPVICLLLTHVGGFRGEWQSGNLDDIVCYLLILPAAMPFYPFVLYPMACMTLLLLKKSHSQYFIVRLGIYSGLLLALQYGFILFISIGTVSSLTITAVAFILFAGAVAIICGLAAFGVVRWAVPVLWAQARRLSGQVLRRWSLLAQWSAFAAVTLFLVVSMTGGEAIAEMLGASISILIIGNLAAAPFWALFVYAVMGWWIYQQQKSTRQYSLAQILIVISWLGAYLAAWRWGLRLALTEYSKLPTEPPGGCYVVTAAARGHSWWVGTDRKSVTGESGPANNQMRYLKAADLALAVAAPRLHRRVRSFYDRVGPRWASRLRHPLAADMAYTMLKPAEWITRLFLAAFLPDFDRLAKGLYRDTRSGIRDAGCEWRDTGCEIRDTRGGIRDASVNHTPGAPR